MRADPRDHVADVGQPLAEIILLDPGERGRVALEDDLQGRERRQVLGLDQRADLRQQRLVVDDLEVALEDLGLGRAELLLHLGDDRLELGGRRRHRAVEPLDLGRDQRRVGERLRLARPEHRVDPVGDPHDDARTDRDSFVHHTLSLAESTAS